MCRVTMFRGSPLIKNLAGGLVRKHISQNIKIHYTRDPGPLSPCRRPAPRPLPFAVDSKHHRIVAEVLSPPPNLFLPLLGSQPAIGKSASFSVLSKVTTISVFAEWGYDGLPPPPLSSPSGLQPTGVIRHRGGIPIELLRPPPPPPHLCIPPPGSWPPSDFPGRSIPGCMQPFFFE